MPRPSALAFATGLLSLLVFWLPFVRLVGLALAVAALVLGIRAARHTEGAEAVVSVVGAVLGGVTLLVFVVYAAAVGAVISGTG